MVGCSEPTACAKPAADSFRLNDKLKARNVFIDDLVSDLSDGVSHLLAGENSVTSDKFIVNRSSSRLGDSHPPP